RVVLERAELAGEGELLLVAELLVAEHQHGMVVHARLDRGDLVRVERPAAIDTGNLAGKNRSERTDRYRHAATNSKKGIIPAKAGIRSSTARHADRWIPAFAGIAIYTEREL